VDHVPLGVELAEDGPQEALGLHPEPQFEAVLRDGDEVDRLVVGGERVHSGGARFGVDAVELVLDHERPLLFEERVELLPERDEFLGQVLLAEGIVDDTEPRLFPPLPVDRPDPVLDGFLFLDDGLVPLGVGGADGGGALEHHVFEEVAHPGDAGTFVRRSDAGRPAGGHGGHFGADDGEEAHPVREGELLDGNRGLAEQRGGNGEQQGERGEPESGVFHGRIVGNERGWRARVGWLATVTILRSPGFSGPGGIA